MPAHVAFSFVGLQLDRGHVDTLDDPHRWSAWRPTVSLGLQEDWLLDRLELLYQPKAQALAERVAADVASVSPQTQVVLRHLDVADPWDFEDVFDRLLDFADDYPFDEDAEAYHVHLTTGTHVTQICWFLLTESRHFPARLIQTSPPTRGQKRPAAGRLGVIDLDLSRYDRIAQRFERSAAEAQAVLKSGIATREPGFNAMIEQIEQVAVAGRDPILLTGPTGAGKSRLARQIHRLKQQRRLLGDADGPMVEVNCATLRGDTAVSTLFGHVKGAFTGAAADRAGLLAAADGGLLFLDEVGELGPDEQALFLKAIEEKRFRPLGGDREARSDFQLVCGTNRDLHAEAAAGRFRRDLLARIDLWTFRLPGLAERRADIEPNLAYELARHAAETGQRVRFNKEASARFLAFANDPASEWSANFRDLSSAVRRMATLAPGGRIGVEQVDEEARRLRAVWGVRERPSGGGVGDDALLLELLGADRLAELDRFDRPQLAEVVRVCRVSTTPSEAGRTLFAASRQRRSSTNDADRLRKYLARMGLTFAELRGTQCPG